MMSVIIRPAASDVDPLEVVFFRNVFKLLFMMRWFLKMGFAGLRTGRLEPDFHVLMVYRAGSAAAG